MMNYAQQQRNPTKHMVGIVLVILFHIVLVYALVSGLARKAVQIIEKPLETKIIEEIKPPPEEVKPPPPPKFVPPPPPFIPPPEISVQAPVVQTNAIAVVTNVKPAPAPPPPPPPPPREVPKQQLAAVACPNSTRVMSDNPYPREAQRDGISGKFIVEFTVGPNGEVKDAAVVGSANRYLARAALTAVSQFKCNAQGQDVKVTVPFTFNLE